MRKAELDRRAMQTDDPVYLTKAGIEKLKRQITNIKRDLPHEISELQRTREMGDLSENAAYQAAKHNVRRMQAKLFQLNERLKVVQVIENTGSDTIQLGSTVTVSLNGKESVFELVGPLETNPLKGRISHESPLGKTLVGHKAGEEVRFESPTGQKEYKILDVK